MSVRVPHVTAGLAALLSAVAVGCGGDDSGLLRDAQAAGLKDGLEQVRAAVDAGDCEAATRAVRDLRSAISDLGGQVDRSLRVRLGEEVDEKLGPAAREQCDDPRTETIPTVTTQEPTAPTEPPPETEPEPEPTTTTETTPPPTETTTEPPPTETTPPPLPEDPGESGGFGEESGDGT